MLDPTQPFTVEVPVTADAMVYEFAPDTVYGSQSWLYTREMTPGSTSAPT